jgi:hypothetical protein
MCVFGGPDMHSQLANVPIQMKMGFVCKPYALKNHRIFVLETQKWTIRVKSLIYSISHIKGLLSILYADDSVFSQVVE